MIVLLKFRKLHSVSKFKRFRGILLSTIMTSPKNDSFVEISQKRVQYRDDSLLESNLSSLNPIRLFNEWFTLASKDPNIPEVNAMCLATADENGVPSARFVLLKFYSHEGFDFFTNYESRKSTELSKNPLAALVFYWQPLKRQVRIEGTVQKLDSKKSDEYFNSRPVESQISAWASKQSEIIANRDEIDKAEKEIADKYKNSEMQRPPYWGGWRLIPHTIEFWQGHSNRSHDRIRFRRPKENEKIDGVKVHNGEDGWIYERLMP